ncbi:MAG: hypothetical protein M0P69_21055 [Bacteroidales bacterium]|nr:hypothetical protein [Bacteroidales bacterium]
MSCNHLSDCQRCGHIVQDLEDLVKDLEEEIERLNDDLKAEGIALKRAVSRINQSEAQWPLRSRWVPFSEREPGRDNEVFARNIKDGMIATIKFFEDGPMRYIVNGESFIWDDDEVNEIPEWEWLEVKEKGGE